MSTARARGGDARIRLLEAAVGVIAADGWAAATSRVVAERAGVNNALVHYYFGSVEELRRAAVAYALESELAGPVIAIAEAASALDGIVAAVAALTVRQGGSPGQRVLVEALVRSLRDETLRADNDRELRRFREMLAARLADDRAAGLVRADADPQALAVVLAALLDGLLLHMLCDPTLDARSPSVALVDLLRSSRDSPGEVLNEE